MTDNARTSEPISGIVFSIGLFIAACAVNALFLHFPAVGDEIGTVDEALNLGQSFNSLPYFFITRLMLAFTRFDIAITMPDLQLTIWDFSPLP